jgi:hypothetical protein
MDFWVWLAAALVGFALLQVALYRYFHHESPPSEGTTTHGSPDTGPETGMALLEINEADQQSQDHTDNCQSDGKRCVHCGARNERDPVYTYCRQCGEPLR